MKKNILITRTSKIHLAVKKSTRNNYKVKRQIGTIIYSTVRPRHQWSQINHEWIGIERKNKTTNGQIQLLTLTFFISSSYRFFAR